MVIGVDGDLDRVFNLPNFLFFDQDLVRVLNFLNALFLDRTGCLYLLLRLAVAFADPFVVALGGDLAEDAIVDPGDAAAEKMSVGVVVAASTDALVVLVVAATV